jgi:hypothetical protein
LDENYRDRKQEGFISQNLISLSLVSTTYIIPTKKKLIVFGGKSVSPHLLLNDVYELDLQSLAWKKLHIRGDAPLARYYHSG